MKKLYIYPFAKTHVHDDMEHYKNTVPLSNIGISKHFKVVADPNKADYFYMGQIENSSFHLYNEIMFKWFKQFPEKHICDVEGEGGMSVPQWLHKCIITMNGPLKKYENIEYLFTRPTFSHLLVDIINSPKEAYPFPDNKSLGFRGYLNHKTRAMLIYTLDKYDFQKELHVNRVWYGPSENGSDIQKKYIDTMLNNAISLCPRGSGIDSVRLLESCYFTRVPVLISDLDYFLVGEDTYDLSFIPRIIANSPDELKEGLDLILDKSDEELHNIALKARKYFDEVIVKYFEDPTKYFLDWLEAKNEDI